MDNTVSILVPMRNAAPYVRQCINSLLDQRAVNSKIIVIDDGSTDDSRSIVSHFKSNRIAIIDGPQSGIADCLNTGLEHAKGSIIMRCDADDAYSSGRIKQQIDFLARQPHVDAVCGAFSAMDRKGKHLLDYECGGNSPVEITSELRKGETRTHLCTFAVRASLIEKTGKFRSYFKTAEDIDYQFRLAEHGRIFYQPLNWYQYRIHPQSITHTQKEDLRVFYENMAKSFQVQRRVTTIGDCLDNGRPPKLPESDSPPSSADDHVQGLLLARAWQQHAVGAKSDAVFTGMRAVIDRPLSASAWRNLAALVIK